MVSAWHVHLSYCSQKGDGVVFCLQESEGEEAADSRVTLAQDVGRGNMASRQSRVKLQEVRIQGFGVDLRVLLLSCSG